MSQPIYLDDAEAAVDAIIERVGTDIIFGMPLGLGKPVHLVNALYARAKADPTLRLTLLTALSLQKPQAGSEIEAAFLDPFVDRVFAGVPDLDYMTDLRARRLPPNVRIKQFFFSPGSQMGNPAAQQDYICSNYTHAARDVFAQGCNVAAQSVAREERDGVSWFSLSANPDTSPELVRMLRAAEAAGERPICVIGEVNQQLPYMRHDAEVPAGNFDLILEAPTYSTPLFPTPKMPVGAADYLIGLQASALVRDSGSLQIGIGAMGDAIVHGLLLRHREPDAYRALLADCGALERAGELVDTIGGLKPFEHGLYGSSEMFVDGFLHLMQAGVLKRRVYDFWALQQLINAGEVDPGNLDASVLDGMERLGVRVIRSQDFRTLQHHGLLRDELIYEAGSILLPDGQRIRANLADPASRAALAKQGLGTALRRGVVLHGGFFLGPASFYQTLREMPDDERDAICMTGVDRVNQLDANPRLLRAQRVHARFINTGLMATLNGAVVSDGLENGQVISGVGGQYNFVDMAHHLPDGRSILMIRATRDKDGRAQSNIVWNYGHCTIPRHLRDIVITEYGVADLRSKTDAEVIKAMLNIADSRFQPALLEQAKAAGKIEADHTVPPAWQQNRPERLAADLAPHRNRLPDFPLGHDFTDTELALSRALPRLKAQVAGKSTPTLLLMALRAGRPSDAVEPCLERMQLAPGGGLRQTITRRLLAEALRNTSD